MKKFISLVLSVIILCLSLSVSYNAFAADGILYYVDSVSGDDSNSGLSESSAWKTIEKASQKTYSTGDKILFKAGGVYTGTFVAKGNGTAENPITVSSYGDMEKDGLPLFATQEDVMLIYIHNVNGWTVENIEFTAPNGKGIHIIADNEFGVMSDITVKGCTFHDIVYKDVPSCPDANAPIFIANYGKNTRIDNIILSDLNIYDCGRGISTFGITIEWHRDIFVSPDVSYNRNFLFENITMNNIYYDAVIITSINGLTVRNCALINTALLENWFTAPMWSHHAKNLLVENCEIAGSTNYKDGMAVDFDGWTTDSTYQYVYSHDNIRFINNCIYDDITKNANCTVRYCLSVNDNKSDNNFGQLLSTPSYDYTVNNDSAQYMDNFKFYNNTIINGGDFRMYHVRNSYVANNIFYTDDIMQAFQTLRYNKDDLTKYQFTGEFTNNCFYGCAIPSSAKNSVNADPQFIGTDLTDKNSFILSENSPLFGKGVQVEEDMGECDFYGNPLNDTHNIGCYEGDGEKVENERFIFCFIGDFFTMVFGYLVSAIKNLIEIA